MRLLTGPAGSGKTTLVLDQFRRALRTGEAVRLLVPTATMALHLQNRLARDGFVFRRSLIQTLSGFVEPWAADIPQAPDAVVYLIVEEAARRVNRPEFARVAHLPGFCAALARTIGEFSSAGCDSDRLAARLPVLSGAPLAPAFLAVYREVEAELARRSLALRGKRLELAAARIAASQGQGAGNTAEPITSIWLDGFHALPDPELSVIAALGRATSLTVTLTQSTATELTRARLLNIGFQEEPATRLRTTPAMAVVQAPAIEREVEEIARRILDQASAGRPFREIGIVVRAAAAYVPILKSTLERFGIPARFYLDSALEEHAAVRFLTGAVDAMLTGWDHAKTLAVLRLSPRFADTPAMDRFDFAVREFIPNAGLDSLKSAPGAEALSAAIDSLATLEEWRPLILTPAGWTARFLTLRNLFRPARPAEPANHELALLYRSQSAVLDLFDQAVEEAAQALDATRALPLPGFWRTVKSVLRLKPLRLADGRRNVVHVLSAPEARQWALPVVFVCGMVEKQFPQPHRQDPFFPDAARTRLNAQGIRLRTAAEFDLEERALFDSAIASASILVTLSYPEFDARGDRNLPSLFLDDFVFDLQHSHPVRPTPRRLVAPAADRAIHDPALLDYLRQKTAKVSPTALEMYLQCAFQYFGGRTLKLQTAPLRPEDRLNFLLQGSIVHEVLATWYAGPQSLPPGPQPPVPDPWPPVPSPRPPAPSPRPPSPDPWPPTPGPQLVRGPRSTAVTALHSPAPGSSPALSPAPTPQPPAPGPASEASPAPGPASEASPVPGPRPPAPGPASEVSPSPIAAIFEAIFNRERERLNIPNRYHTERLRNGMLEDLRAFAADTKWQRDAFESLTEQKFVFPLDETLEITGKIDRLDRSPDGRVYVIDYKYSAAARTKGKLKDENLLQAPLYMMAAERAFHIKPDGMFYVGLKAGIEYVGWSGHGLLNSLPLPENWQEIARERILQAVAQVRAGRVEVAPANPDSCRFCDFRDVCRVQLRKAAVVAEGA